MNKNLKEIKKKNPLRNCKEPSKKKKKREINKIIQIIKMKIEVIMATQTERVLQKSMYLNKKQTQK